MWGTKKLDTPQAVVPEPKTLLTNKKSANTVLPSDSTGDRAKGWLGSSLHVKGEITGTEDLVIDGSVEGLIQLGEGKLTVGTAAKLTADIIAHDVVVYGQVKGDVHVKGRIEIKKDGSVIGNLTTAQILIEDGADFRGTIEIDRSAAQETQKNVSSRAAAAGAGRA
jgi:cytoskeletal protein CcmA (bactofilin family)